MASRAAVEIDHETTLAALALVAAILSLLLLVTSLQPPPPSSAELFSFAASHRPGYGWFGSLVLAWSVFSVPLIVTTGTMLRSKGPALAGMAQILSAVGVLLLGFALFMHTGVLLSIVDAGSPARAEDAAYHAAILSSFRYYATDPGLMTWGLGQFLFGLLAWRSDALPNWCAVVGIVGGVAGLLTLAVYQTGALALVQLLSFTVWGFAAGFSLLRARRNDSPGT